MDRRVMLSCVDVRVITGLCMAGFAVGAAVDTAGARRHWNDLKSIPLATPEVSAELREHREGKVFFSVVRAIGGIAMTILLAYLTFFVEPARMVWKLTCAGRTALRRNCPQVTLGDHAEGYGRIGQVTTMSKLVRLIVATSTPARSSQR